MTRCAVLIVAAGCALNADAPPPRLPTAAAVAADPGVCREPPAGERRTYRSSSNELFKSLGAPRFRGIDLVASVDDPEQVIAGKLAYTAADKDVKGEDVELYACVANLWNPIGFAITGSDGRFTLTLRRDDRLAPGLRDLYAYVPGHGGGVRFLAYVAPRGTALIATDIDGTLTESEEAIFNTVLFGDDIAPQPDAPRALAIAAARTGRPIVYLSSRGDQLTEVTRRWLEVHGFPRGPVRLARASITPPGPRTISFKTEALRGLAVPIAAGIGNRATDIAAYRAIGLAPHQILINLPEFADEVRADLAAGRATAFDSYRELPALIGAR